jgi:hypothetical protein
MPADIDTHRDALILLTLAIDENQPVFEEVCKAVAAVGSDEAAGGAVYRIVCRHFRVHIVGSTLWKRSPRREDLLHSWLRGVIGSPADDTHGRWTEVGRYYRQCVAEQSDGQPPTAVKAPLSEDRPHPTPKSLPSARGQVGVRDLRGTAALHPDDPPPKGNHLC